MKAAKIDCVINLEYTDMFWDPSKGGHHVLKRQRTINHECTNVQLSFDAKVHEQKYYGFDMQAALEKLSEDQKQAETGRLQALFDYVTKNQDIRAGALFDAVDEYVSGSVLFKGHDKNTKHSLDVFLRNFASMSRLFEDFNEKARDLSESKQSALLDQLAAQIKKVWGKNVTIRNDAAEKLARAFKGFKDMIADLDEKQPPLSFDTLVSYDIRVRQLVLPEVNRGMLSGIFNRKPHISGVVKVWELPAAFFRAQKKMGILPENVPPFRLCLDQLGDKESAFRISAEGETLNEMMDAIEDKLTQEDAPQISGDWPLQLTMHSYGDQRGIFVQTAKRFDLDDLRDDMRSRLHDKAVEFTASVARTFLPK